MDEKKPLFSKRVKNSLGKVSGLKQFLQALLTSLFIQNKVGATKNRPYASESIPSEAISAHEKDKLDENSSILQLLL